MSTMIDASSNLAPDFTAVKSRQQGIWASGDFSIVASRIVFQAEHLCETADVQAGWRVLDVATGSGNAALAAARRGCEVVGIDFVPELLQRARIRAAAEATDGWLYLVTVTGTTGARVGLSPALPPLVERVRAVSDVPVYAGFGISTPEIARAVSGLADGVVVGSRAVEVAENGPDELRAFVASLRVALDS